MEKLQVSVAPGLAEEGKALGVCALAHIANKNSRPLASSQRRQETLTCNQLL
jgi:hypothetical protein